MVSTQTDGVYAHGPEVLFLLAEIIPFFQKVQLSEGNKDVFSAYLELAEKVGSSLTLASFGCHVLEWYCKQGGELAG